ncbi:MAG: 50S ribosomal protein L2, partial [uncultured bacterium]
MPIVKRSPTSPGRRAVISVIDKTLHRGKPHKPLLAKKSKTGGRNNQGRITTRH